CRTDRRRRAAPSARTGDGGEGAPLRRALSARRGFSRRPGGDAAGLRHRAGARPSCHAGDRRRAPRRGAMESAAMKPSTPAKAAKRPTNVTLRTVEELCDHALVRPERIPELAEIAARYAVALTPAMAALIDPSDPHDPIAKQFVPD